MNGVVISFFPEKGYGFIRDESGEDVFFHVTNITNTDILKKNDKVTFATGLDFTGRVKAVNVALVM